MENSLEQYSSVSENNFNSDLSLLNLSENREINNFTTPKNEVPIPIELTFNEGHLLSIVGYSIIFVFSATGNLSVLFILIKKNFKRSSLSRIDYMLLHLAIADLMVTFLMMPLEVIWSITVSWKAGDFMCRLTAFFRVFGLYLSSFVLVSLALDRYLAVMYPMKIIDSIKRGRVMIQFSWILSALCSSPQVFVFHLASHPDFRWFEQCISFGSLSPQNELIYNLFVLLLTYALPFIIILFLYCRIVIKLFKKAKSNSDSSYVPTNGTRQLSVTQREGLRRSGIGYLEKAKVKTLKMTIVIVFIFFICWTPYYVMCLWYWIDRSSASGVDLKIQKALFIFACTNSAANPIVYSVFHFKNLCNNNETQRNRDNLSRSDSIQLRNGSFNTSRRATSRNYHSQDHNHHLVSINNTYRNSKRNLL